ncbi:hypothetical protein GCM10023169_37810 [Georgenia halophila]|uniref:Uncharacterized protein n=1 Tax=Georgenia halophila TaxID=620889 RepID=A0ABP8LPS6_9MICO
MAVGSRICARLDPIMTARGFQRGQVGFGVEGGMVTCVSVIYCASQADFSSRFPGVVDEDDDAWLGACTDLTVEAAPVSDPRLTEINLDGQVFGDVLREVRREDLLPRLEGLHEVPLDAALDRLAVFVGALLEITDDSPTSQENDDHDE